jgi:hypothetical protein
MAQTEAALADPGRDLGHEAMPPVGSILAVSWKLKIRGQSCLHSDMAV